MLLWKLVFWVATIFFVIKLGFIPFSNNINLIDLAVLIFSGISLIPLYGYSYQVVVGSKTIAVIIFSINALFTSLGLALFVYELDYSKLNAYTTAAIVIGLVMTVLYIYPQFKYAFSSQALWQNKNA